MLEALQCVFRSSEIEIVKREVNPYTSTFNTEVVLCRIDGIERRLLLKRGGSHNDEYHQGVAYEARIYKEVLGGVDLTLPAFYGSYRYQQFDTLMWLEYLDAARLNLTVDNDAALVKAAQWAGAFHRRMAARVSSYSPDYLTFYTPEYYRGWALRAFGSASVRYPWLEGLAGNLEPLVRFLCGIPVTVIHGEYYPANILLKDGTIYPIDWESAAVAPGEIDLMSLVEDWDPELQQQCRHAYELARWPEGAPVDFDRRLDAAGIYLSLRWSHEWAVTEVADLQFSTLRTLLERVGLLH